MTGTITPNQNNMPHTKRARPDETDVPHKRSRETNYPTVHAGELGAAYPPRDTTKVMYSPHPKGNVEAPPDLAINGRRMLSPEEFRGRHILPLKSQRGQDAQIFLQTPVTQTYDDQNTSTGGLSPLSLAAIAPFPPFQDATFANNSNASTMFGEGGRRPPGNLNASQGQQIVGSFPRDRVHDQNHGSTDPGAQNYAYHGSPHHDTVTVTKHGRKKSSGKGVKNCSPKEAMQQGSISSLSAPSRTEEPFASALNSPSYQQPRLSNQKRTQNGKMNHPSYTQYPHQSQYMQQPQQVQYPQQSVPVMNMPAIGQDTSDKAAWLQHSQDDLLRGMVTEVPGIPFNHAVQWLYGPGPVLLPQDIWYLRSLMPKQRYDAFHVILSLGQRLRHIPPTYNPLHQQAWTDIRTVSARLHESERNWYAYYQPSNWSLPLDGDLEFTRVKQLQAQGVPTDPAYAQQSHARMLQHQMGSAQQNYVYPQNMVQHQTRPEPVVQPSIAPPVQQPQIEPEVIVIPSKSPSPNPSVPQAQANGDSASSQSAQRSPRSSLNINGKREAEAEPEIEDHDNDTDDLDAMIMEELGFDQAEPEQESDGGGDDDDALLQLTNDAIQKNDADDERKEMNERRAKKVAEAREDESYYELYPEKVNEIYLGNKKNLPNSDGSRKPADPAWMKMAAFWVWAKDRGGRARFITHEGSDSPPAPSPAPAKSKAKQQQKNPEEPQIQKPKAKRQKTKANEPQMAQPQPQDGTVLPHTSLQASVADQIVSKEKDVAEPQLSEAVALPPSHATASPVPASPPMVQSAHENHDTPTKNNVPIMVSNDPPAHHADHLIPEPHSPPPSVQLLQAPFPFKPAPAAPPSENKVPLNGTPKVSHMAKFEAMKVVQAQLHLRSLAPGRSEIERIVINGIDVAQLLDEGMPQGKIVDKIAPHVEVQAQREPERRSQGTRDEDELRRRLIEFLNPESSE